MKDRIFVIPTGVTGEGNDGEMREIRNILIENKEQVIETAQSWGASWAGIEGHFRKKIAAAVAGGKTCYGVELAGGFGILHVDIDHPAYERDDRSNPKSSLEQIADLLGVELDRRQRGIAINDTQYIHGLIAAGYTPEEIADIRRLDRCAQGVSEEDEITAEAAVSNAMDVNSRYGTIRIVHLTGDKCSPVTDRLFGQADRILICCSTGEVDYYGSAKECSELQAKFGGWTGGGSDNGFWGISGINSGDVFDFLLA